MNNIKNILFISLLFVFAFAKTDNYKVKSDIEIIVNSERPVLVETTPDISVQTREEITLFSEDFETGAQGWETGSGWQFDTSN